jgi:hypothetical protein
MSKAAITETTHDKIIAFCLDPENNPLNDEQKKILNRLNLADDLLRRYPRTKEAAKLLQLKYPDLSRAQIYRDIADAKRLFNFTNPVDKEWVRRWVIEDCFRLIEIAKNQGTRGFKAWNMARAQLIKAAQLDIRDDDKLDPSIMDQHNFFTVININGNNMKIDLEAFLELPVSTRKKLSDALNAPIEEQDAVEIMNS